MTEHTQPTLPGFDLYTAVIEVFTTAELQEVAAAAVERGIGVHELIHDAVMNDLYR